METKEEKSYLQIAFFPHLYMGNIAEIDFGFAKVWNFHLKKDLYITDLATKEKIEKILKMYLSNNSPLSRPIKGIGIVLIEKNDFRAFNDSDKYIIKLIQNILFLCFLSKNNTLPFNGNTGHGMASSENFDVVFQKFNLQDDYVAEFTGYILPFMVGGFTFDELRFHKPNFIPSPSNFSLDMDLFRDFIKLKKGKPAVFKRIINSTEIMRESYYNSQHLSENARVLLQMSAFEILLKIPEGREQRKFFKEKVGAMSRILNKRLFINYYSKPRNSSNKEYLTINQLWAEKFYLLRNKIIHGNSPSKKEFIFKNKQRHIEIALLFFILGVKKQLEKSIRKSFCDNEIIWKKWEDKTFNQKREEFVLEFYPERLLKKF